ncbi:MAG: hypothetical protein JW958_12890 [Candidatus Eisenbacteria bacterium]|nr:hypothetical protein [Candidatus Eisenbacteria bacterium]
MQKDLVHRIEQIETILYGVIALLLIVACVAILGTAAVHFVSEIRSGNVVLGLVHLLEYLLLAFMAVELLYTVCVSLRTHKLSAEPFLIVGLVAAIRRILAVSVEGSTYLHGDDLLKFRLALWEIALLTGSVLILVISIHVLRRGRTEE